MDRPDKIFFSGLAAFFVLTLSFLIWIAVSEQADYNRRMLDCQRDGKAEYEDLYGQLDVGADVHNLTPIPLHLAYKLSLDNTKQTEYD